MLNNFFAPASIAFIGASPTPGEVGHDLLANLCSGGFKGKIWPVTPSAGKICGHKCYAAIGEIPEPVDLAVAALPGEEAKAAVRQAVAAGVKGVAVVSAGFRETGSEGAALERDLASICRQYRVRMLGPNCLGLINTGSGLNLSLAGELPRAGGISVISQSGALITVLLDRVDERRLGIAKVISIGNKADLTEVDLLRYLAHDPDTKVIIAYLEEIVAGDEFIKVAEEASSRKPVIILKSGNTPAGSRAAASHTGGLAGSDTAYGAAFSRSGIIRAEGFEALVDYAAAFAMQPLPGGKRVLIITDADGFGAMAADSVEKSGLVVAGLVPNTAAGFKKAKDDPEVDAILFMMMPRTMTEPAKTARSISRALNGKKTVLVSVMGGSWPGRGDLAAASLPDYPSPERAVSALRAMSDYYAWRNRPPRKVTRFRVNRRRVERVISRGQRSGRFHLGEVKAKSILAAYGFMVPTGHLALTSDEAVEIATQIGFPVVMKIVSPDIVHKSDLGGVKLGISTAEGARDAFDLIVMRIRERAPDALIEGIYVEKMLDRGLEVIIGMNRDRQFGPMLMFGLGGIFVEVMKDVTFHLAPITRDEAMQMLKSTRSYAMLEGRRGQMGVDLEAIANGLQRISQLTTDFPQIDELDINPFIVGAIGSDPWVADARIYLREE